MDENVSCFVWSWSIDWGEDGYVKIARSDSNNSPGICGIAMEPSFINVD